jgi:hypothetical protein
MSEMSEATIVSERGWPRVTSGPVLQTTLVVLGIQFVLNVAYLATFWAGDVPRPVDFNAEANLTTWWSSLLMLAAGALAAGLYLCERRLRRRSWPLALLSLGLLGLSLEEVAAIHETIGHYANVASHVADWTLVYLPAVALGAFVMVHVLVALPRPYSLLVAAGLGSYVVGLGLEMSLVVTDDLASQGRWRETAEVLVEENSELLGSALIGSALAGRLTQQVPHVLKVRAQDA